MIQFDASRLPLPFWSRVKPCPMSGCGLWPEWINEHGYGAITYNNLVCIRHAEIRSCSPDPIESFASAQDHAPFGSETAVPEDAP
jgi:hypothetical protein